MAGDKNQQKNKLYALLVVVAIGIIAYFVWSYKTSSKRVKYIRLTKDMTTFQNNYTFAISEIKVFGKSSSDTPINSKDLKTSASSFNTAQFTNLEHNSSKLIDGNTDYDHSWASNIANEPGTWVQVELTKPQEIQTVVIHNAIPIVSRNLSEIDRQMMMDRMIGVRLDIINENKDAIFSTVINTNQDIYSFSL